MIFDNILLGMFSQKFWQGPGTDSFTSHLLEILIMLFVAWLLGWLLWQAFVGSRLKARIAELEGDLSSLKKKHLDLETNYRELQYSKEKVENELAACRSKRADVELQLRACQETTANLENKLQASLVAVPVVDTNAGISASDDVTDDVAVVAPVVSTNDNDDEDYSMGGVFSNDDLKIVEGIGPKIEGLLKADGLNTWADLGNADQPRLQKILTDAGPRYRVHNPKTWPDQAKLAAEGKWEKLVEYQKFLDTGRDDTKSTGGTPSKVEKLYAKKIGFASFKTNDLKIVEGIGPKIAGLLNAAGINTWKALADSSVETIQKVLDDAGDRYRLADPKTWPKQSELAAAGDWKGLKKYQDYLVGGKDV